MAAGDSNQTVLIPVLSDNLTTHTFLAPTEFVDRLQMHALCLVDAMQDDDRFDPANQMMQATSFIIRRAVGRYLDEEAGDDLDPPKIV